jgi:hypothetical protein
MIFPRTSANGHSEVASIIIENEITADLLPYITEDHLKEMGITSMGQCLLVFQYITSLIGSSAPKPKPGIFCNGQFHPLSHEVLINFSSPSSPFLFRHHRTPAFFFRSEYVRASLCLFFPGQGILASH